MVIRSVTFKVIVKVIKSVTFKLTGTVISGVTSILEIGTLIDSFTLKVIDNVGVTCS
jgi:hypothetical protein